MPGRKKSLIIPSLIVAALILLAAAFIPYIRASFIDSLHLPLELLFAINREIQGIVLYHYNLVQNQRLEREISLVKRQLYESTEVYLENARLRELLDFKEKSIYPLTAANVIGYDPSNLSSIIIINKGKEQGIKRDCAVITNSGLVGRVVEVGRLTSKVLVINDINSGVAALIQRSRQKGLISGTLSRGLVMHYLPPGADVRISDTVITSGLSGLYPKGILIGKVIKIREENYGEMFAVIEPSTDLTRLEEVLVVLPK